MKRYNNNVNLNSKGEEMAISFRDTHQKGSRFNGYKGNVVSGEVGKAIEVWDQICDIEHLYKDIFEDDLAETLWIASKEREIRQSFKDIQLEDDQVRISLYNDYKSNPTLTWAILDGMELSEIESQFNLTKKYLNSSEFKRLSKNILLVEAIKGKVGVNQFPFPIPRRQVYRDRYLTYYADVFIKNAQFKYYELEMNEVIEVLEEFTGEICFEKPDLSKLRKTLISVFNLVKKQSWDHEVDQQQAIKILENFIPVNMHKRTKPALVNPGVYQLVQYRMRTKHSKETKSMFTEPVYTVRNPYSYSTFISVVMKAYSLLKRIEDTQSNWSLQDLSDLTGLTDKSVISSLSRDIKDPKNSERFSLLFKEGIEIPLSYEAGAQWIRNRSSYKGVFGDENMPLNFCSVDLDEIKETLVFRKKLLGSDVEIPEGVEFHQFVEGLLNDGQKLLELSEALKLDAVSFLSAIQKYYSNYTSDKLLKELKIKQAKEKAKQVVDALSIQEVIQEKIADTTKYSNLPDYTLLFNLNHSLRGGGGSNSQNGLNPQNVDNTHRPIYRYYLINNIDHNKIHAYLDIAQSFLCDSHFDSNGRLNKDFDQRFVIVHEHHFKNKQVLWIPFTELSFQALLEKYQDSKSVIVEKITSDSKPQRPIDLEAYESLSKKHPVIKCSLLTGNTVEDKACLADVSFILEKADLWDLSQPKNQNW